MFLGQGILVNKTVITIITKSQRLWWFQLQNTPLHVATRVGFLDCVNYLLECGSRINERDCEGDTPIHDAIRLARPKVVRTLIIHGANMSIKNNVCRNNELERIVDLNKKISFLFFIKPNFVLVYMIISKRLRLKNAKSNAKVC